MTAPSDDQPFDYDAAVIALLTLRVNTPRGHWLSDADFETYAAVWREAEEAEGEETAAEYMLLAMMNAARLAIAHLAQLTGETEDVWLQRIATDLRSRG